jgi:2-keto-3-deoxy-L-rhamnonate aldolase RhmA
MRRERSRRADTRRVDYAEWLPPAVRYGLKWDEYLATADKNLLIMLQIETAEAVKNAGEILSVPGVDVFFIGSVDLSSSLGFLGKADLHLLEEHVSLVGREALVQKLIVSNNPDEHMKRPH